MQLRIRLAVLAAVVLAGVAASTVLAATIGGDEDYVVAAGETIDDNLYAFGNTVRIEGVVEGDLISAGTRVEVAPGGAVRGDLMAAGQGVIVEGRVDGDIRAAGFIVRVADGASVGGEVVAAGYSVEILSGAAVGGDMLGAAGQGILDGSVGGDVRFGGGGLEINGQVSGDVDAEVDAAGNPAPDMSFMQFMPGPKPPAVARSVPMGLTVGPDARIDGALVYTSPGASDVAPGAAAGGVTYTERASPSDAGVSGATAAAAAPQTAGDRALGWFGSFLKWFLSLAIVGLLLGYLAPLILVSAERNLLERAPASAGAGCLTMILSFAGVIALVVATILALIFVGAIQLGPLVPPILSASFLTFAVLTAGMLLLAWIGRVAVGYWLGRLILDRLAPTGAGNRYAVILVGVLVYALLTRIPWVGWVVDWLGVVLGLGAIAGWLWARLRGPRVGSSALPAEV